MLVDALAGQSGFDISHRDLSIVSKAISIAHPYHILGLIQDGLGKDDEIYFLGLFPSPEAKDFLDIDRYIRIHIENEWTSYIFE